MDISRKILSDPINKWFFKNAGTESYIVGGYVRDMLLGNSSKDKDYALSNNAKETSLLFAKKFKGTYIELKENRTYRVVINRTDIIDFNSMEGDIYNDLKQRDFSINAMAWSPLTGILDPLNGMHDLLISVVRMIDHLNLLQDPLRLLRAYRIAALYGFEIEDRTRDYLRQYADEIKKSAPERITDELFKLLNIDKSGKYVNICYQDGVLNKIVNMSKLDLGEYLEQTKSLESLISRLNRYDYEGVRKEKVLKVLKSDLGQGLSIEGFLRLALLLVKSTKRIKNDVGYLRISNLIKNKLIGIQNAYTFMNGRITDRKLFEIYVRAGDAVFEMSLILAIKRKRNLKRFIHRCEDFNRLMGKCILSGHEIQNTLNIFPGPMVGQIKREIIQRQFTGLIKNKSDAREWIMSNLT